MLTHGDRHLPCIPHTRCYSPNTRSLTHSCLTHTYHTTHTRGGTHPRCLIHTPCLTPTRLFAHACRFCRTRGLFRLRCPFHTWRAGKHALWHTRYHTTHTDALRLGKGFGIWNLFMVLAIARLLFAKDTTGSLTSIDECRQMGCPFNFHPRDGTRRDS